MKPDTVALWQAVCYWCQTQQFLAEAVGAPMNFTLDKWKLAVTCVHLETVLPLKANYKMYSPTSGLGKFKVYLFTLTQPFTKLNIYRVQE